MCGFGSSGNSAPTTQFSTQTTTAAPQAQAMYNQAWQNAQKTAQRPFQPYSYDPNAFVAPMNQTQLQAVGNIGSYQGSSDPFFHMGANMVGQSGNASSADMMGRYMNPYMNQVVDPVRGAVEQQQAFQRSQLAGDQIKAGAFGQERGQLARAVLAGQQNLGMGQALSPLYQDAYKTGLGAAQADLQRQMQSGQAMGQLGQGYTQTGLGAAQALLGAGTVGQQTQQAGLQALYNQYLMQQQYPFQQAQFLSSIAAGLGPGFGGTTSGFQTSMAPLSSMGMPLSDPAVKVGASGEEPEVIGSTNDGQDIYRYRVINPDTGEVGPVQIGLMADEVERRRPDAIGAYKGLRTVDYEKATDGAARMGGGVKPQGGDYADGGGVDDIVNSHRNMYAALAQMGALGIVPESKMVTANLQPAQLSYLSPQQKQQYSIGQALKDATGVYSLGKELKGDYDSWRSKPASGGSITGYDDDQGDVEMRQGPEPTNMPTAKLDTPTLSFAKPQKQDEGSGLDDVLKIGKTIFDIGSKAFMLSDPRVKTGVRPARADGGGVLDDFLDAIGGHGYIDGSSWEDAPPVAGEPMNIVAHPARAAGLRPAARPAPRPAAPPAARPGVVPHPAHDERRAIDFHSNRGLGVGALPPDRFTPFPHGDKREIAFNPPPYGLGDEPRPARFVGFEKDPGIDRLRGDSYEWAKEQEVTDDNRPVGVGMLPFKKGGSVDDEDSLFERLLSRESGGKQFDREGRPLRSSTGALGVAQIMPGTMPEAARYAGLEPDMDRLRTDPEYGRALGKAYLKHQIDTFGGDQAKGVAAYNAGAGGVSRAIRRADAAGGDWRDFLPKETQAYLPGVMGGSAAPMAYSARDARPSSAGLDAIDSATSGKGVVPAASGDETPARGLTGFFRGTPAKDMGEKAGDFLTSERFLVPLLTGLGTMASSQSRYLAPAILQGVGAGAQAYMQVPKTEAETDVIRQEAANKAALTPKIAAEARGVELDNFMKSFMKTPYGNFVFLKDGTPVSQADYMEMTRSGKAPELLGSIPQNGLDMVKKGVDMAGGSSGEQQRQEVPQQQPQKVDVPTDIYDKSSSDAARNEQRVIMNGGMQAKGAEETTDGYRKYVNSEVTVARENAPYVKELSTTLADAYARKGFDTPGFKAGLRSEVSSLANTLYHALGGDPSVDLSKLKDENDVVNKISTLLATQRSAAGGQHAYAALEAIKGAIPNLEMDPKAGAELTAQLMALQQRSVDRDAHFRAYTKESGGFAVDAANDFTNKTEARYQKEQKVLKDLMLNAPEVLKKMMSGTASKEQIDKALKRIYGKGVPSGMWRYFAPSSRG